MYKLFLMMQDLPLPYLTDDLTRNREAWIDAANEQKDDALGEWMREHASEPLLHSLFGNSPYLSRLALHYPSAVRDFYTIGIEEAYGALLNELAHNPAESTKIDVLKRSLRIAKNHMALLVAMADISKQWDLVRVTQALSDFAECCLQRCVEELIAGAHKRGEIAHPTAADSGVIVLGMGKLGGRELNYSSDIDLIIFYEPGRVGYQGRRDEQHFMARLAQDLVQLMQTRTAEGYVFRTDLRLRPDPASTPPAISVDAAYYYYEALGQNWERAAMIKARPVAGDLKAGEKFMHSISPFMWRRSLDFVAIRDIHSIKRQMDKRQHTEIIVKGHNVKLGMGGIREIEFYTQIHQLIWGGRKPELRARTTCDVLALLCDAELISESKETTLRDAYVFFRQLEHRLQMIADAQTHSLPETDAGIAHIACFMGYESTDDFCRDLLEHLHNVHHIFANSFRGSESLGDTGNLVFTGVSHDPDTLQTLKQMGYEDPEKISEIVMGWHHGSTRATRTKRARELLTELMPLLLKRLAATANPDTAFVRFHEFLRNLPAGVQLFSMFSINPHLLDLIADIFGSAPTLAAQFSKHPTLLDAVLYADFYRELPNIATLIEQLDEALTVADDTEGKLDALIRFRNEKQFQAGVHLLQHMVSAELSGYFLSDLADVVLHSLLHMLEHEFAKTHGYIKGGRFAILALGKLGSREMTFGSDIDLVFVYDAPEDVTSDGDKSHIASVYYNRLTQRIINTLSMLGREGQLYEVDTRLRPSGKTGFLAVSIQTLEQYFTESAWTFEYMAFTKARAVAGDEALRNELTQFAYNQLRKKRDPESLRADVVDMRERVAKEFGCDNRWDIKYVRGGLIELDFIAQYLLLLHAPHDASLVPGNTTNILTQLSASQRVGAELASELLYANAFLTALFNRVRLCGGDSITDSEMQPGMQKLLYQSVRAENFEHLQEEMERIEKLVHAHYIALLNPFDNQGADHE